MALQIFQEAYQTSNTGGHPSLRVCQQQRCFHLIASSNSSPCLEPSFTTTNKRPCSIAILSNQERHYIAARMEVSLRLTHLGCLGLHWQVIRWWVLLNIRGSRVSCRSMISLNKSPISTIKMLPQVVTKLHRDQLVVGREEWSPLIYHLSRLACLIMAKILQLPGPQPWTLFPPQTSNSISSILIKARPILAKMEIHNLNFLQLTATRDHRVLHRLTKRTNSSLLQQIMHLIHLLIHRDFKVFKRWMEITFSNINS
jgi:hypothetical protein